MRVLESSLVLASLFNIIWPILPFPFTKSLFPYTIPITCVVFLLFFLHLRVEGPRWQLYFLYFAIFLNLVQLAGPTQFIAWPAGLLVVVSIFLAILLAVPVLPKTDGEFKIGFLRTFPDDPDVHCLVRIYYPVDSVEGGKRIPYLLSGSGVSDAWARFAKMPAFFLSHFKLSETDIFEGATLSSSRDTWPVVAFAHGLAGTPDVYSTPIRELVSKGFVVVTVDHMDGSAAYSVGRSGRQRTMRLLTPAELAETGGWKYALRHAQVQQRVTEVRAGLDTLLRLHDGARLDSPSVCAPLVDDAHSADGAFAMFKGRLATERVAAVGHSFGGATVMGLAAQDNRVKACVNLDGWMLPVSANATARGLTRVPLLLLVSEQFQIWPENMRPMRRYYHASHRLSALATIMGSRHQNFADVALQSPRLGKKLKQIGPMDVTRAFSLIHAYTLAFLHRHLNMLPPSSSSPSSAAVHFGIRDIQSLLPPPPTADEEQKGGDGGASSAALPPVVPEEVVFERWGAYTTAGSDRVEVAYPTGECDEPSSTQAPSAGAGAGQEEGKRAAVGGDASTPLLTVAASDDGGAVAMALSPEA